MFDEGILGREDETTLECYISCMFGVPDTGKTVIGGET